MENVISLEANARRSLHDECVRTMAKISLIGVSNNNDTNRTSELNPELGQKDAQAINDILAQYADGSIVVVGTPGIGKSTIAQHLGHNVVDMDVMFDKMHTGTKEHLLHHEYYTDESGRRRKRTIPFKRDTAYAEDLTTTTRQLSLYAEEFFRQQVQNKIPLIGATPIPADKCILLRADPTSLLRNAENRSQITFREIDYDRTLFVQSCIESIVYELFDEKDVVVYTMSYE